MTVGFVQGNVPQAGLEFNAQRRAVLDNHVNGTEQLATRAPDDLTLVVWPENSSDIDPFRNPDAAAQIDNARRAVGVPLLIGAVLAEPPGPQLERLAVLPARRRRAAALRQAAPGALRRVHPRAAPSSGCSPRWPTSRATSSPATRSASSRCRPPSGDYVALPTICFEVAYDGLMRDSVARRR